MTKDKMINLRLPEEIVEFISEGLYFNGLLRKKFHIDSYQQAAEKHIAEQINEYSKPIPVVLCKKDIEKRIADGKKEVLEKGFVANCPDLTYTNVEDEYLRES